MANIRPPADADNYRVQAGRFGDRFYTDPLPADDEWGATDDDDVYPAVSTVKKAASKDWSSTTIKRLAQKPDELAQIAQLGDEFERKERLSLAADSGLRAAGNRGSVVHQFMEAELEGRVSLAELNEETRPYISVASTFLAAYQPKLVASEFVAIHRTLNVERVARGNEYSGYGGTGDAVVEIDGLMWIVDWKTRSADSRHAAYPEEGAQASAYACADYWIVADAESATGAKRISPLDLEGGLIVSIKPDSYEVFPIDLDEGWAYWCDLHAWWQGRRSERLCVGRKWAPRVAPTSQLADKVEASVASNRRRFDALSEPGKMRFREKVKWARLNPNVEAHAAKVAYVLSQIEELPSLREMQESAAEQRREHAAPEPEQETDPLADLLEVEGGEAPEELVNESRAMFDLVIGEHGRKWCGHRVAEANRAELSFRISELRSLRRAHIYLALCMWAEFRGVSLEEDESEGNIEFSGVLYEVDGLSASDSVTLGYRLAALNYEDAEKLVNKVRDVVASESGSQPAAAKEAEKAD